MRNLQRDARMSSSEYQTLVDLSEAPGRRLRMSDLAAARALSVSGAGVDLSSITHSLKMLAAEAERTASRDWDEEGDRTTDGERRE
jgi:hypothetical protein